VPAIAAGEMADGFSTPRVLRRRKTTSHLTGYKAIAAERSDASKLSQQAEPAS
jgi:hypothetical protein